MNVGTSLHTVSDFAQDVKPFRAALQEAAQIGFGSLMLLNFPGKPALTATSEPDCSLIDLAASDPELVKAAVAEAGLEIAAVYQGCMRVATDEEAAETAEALRGLVRLAGALGSSIVLPNAGVAPTPGMPLADKEPLLQRLASVVMSALEIAPADTRFALDIHYHSVLETVADIGRYFELAPDPRAGITLNIGHMTTNHQEGWHIPQQWPERVHVVAWKDHLLQPPPEHAHAVYSVELGTGDSPFEKYVEALGPDPSRWVHMITFEHVPFEQKHGALVRSLAHLKGLWGE